MKSSHPIVVVQLLSHVWFFAAPWTAAHQASLSFTISQICSDLYLFSQWRHPTISSFVTSFSSCLQSFPASGSFPMGRLFTSGDQSIGASASASALPMNIQGWFHLGLIDLVSLLPKRLSRVFSSTAVQKHQFFSAQPSLWSNSHPYMTTGKTIALTRWAFIGKVMSLLLNAQSRFVTAFLLKSKCSFFVLFCFVLF